MFQERPPWGVAEDFPEDVAEDSPSIAAEGSPSDAAEDPPLCESEDLHSVEALDFPFSELEVLDTGLYTTSSTSSSEILFKCESVLETSFEYTFKDLKSDV